MDTYQYRMPPTAARDSYAPWTRNLRNPLIALRQAADRPPSPEIPEQTIISFGKYNGQTYEFIKKNDVGYCNWVLKQMNTNGGMLQFQIWLKKNTRKVACECCNGSGLVDMI